MTRAVKRVRILTGTGLLVGEACGNYAMMPQDLFINKFLPTNYHYQRVHPASPADICCFGELLTDESILREKEFNIFISLENMGYWTRPENSWGPNSIQRYTFHRKFGYFGCKKVDLYIYNDKSTRTETTTYLSVPAIHFRLAYFKRFQDKHRNTLPKIPFERKHFILFTSRNDQNPTKRALATHLVKAGLPVHHISMYNTILKNTTCYHSRRLLSVLSQYKFVATIENSRSPGYITEKIFNTFLANSVPVYAGAPDINKFISPASFITITPDIATVLLRVAGDKKLYERILNAKKLPPNFNGNSTKYDILPRHSNTLTPTYSP